MRRWAMRRRRSSEPVVAALVGEDLAILLRPGFVGTVTVGPDGTVRVSAPASAWRFLETGAPAEERIGRADT